MEAIIIKHDLILNKYYKIFCVCNYCNKDNIHFTKKEIKKNIRKCLYCNKTYIVEIYPA